MADEGEPERQRRHEERARQQEEFARLKQMADEAAERAVIKMFRALGYDVTAMDDVNDLRDDLRFLRRQRQAGDMRKAETSKTAITAIGGIIVGAIGSLLTWLASGGHRP